MKVEIIRNITKQTCLFIEHFKKFDKIKAVQRIFGDKTPDVIDGLEVEFTDNTLYMSVDYDGRLLVNPTYLATGDFADLYLDVIHELVHVRQVLNGKNCNHALPYVERPLEIEAYRTAVEEARTLGWNESQILSYLDSDLINAEELEKLASALEVSLEKQQLEEEND
jgi:hypothetical protein